MTSFLDDLPDDELEDGPDGGDANCVVHHAELVRPLDQRLQDIRDVEEELYQEAIETLNSVACWSKINPEDGEVPPEWIATLGREAAEIRFRIAKAAWLPTAKAPVGIRVAEHVVMGIAKARALQKQPPAFDMVFVTMPSPQLEEMEVKE